MTDDLDLADIAEHQFAGVLKPPSRPPSMASRLIARAGGKVWYKVGWTCTCCAKIFPQVEAEMLLRGLITDSLDFYQLGWSHAAASAGTHSAGACFDTAQYSDEQIDVWRLHGCTTQHRTPAQGFTPHGHGFPNGCPHGSSGQKSQQVQWNNRQNGLVSRGPIAGRWPIKKWQDAFTERAKKIMALKDDIANAVIEKLKGQIGSLVWNADEIPNTFSGNTANKTVPAKYALQVLGSRTAGGIGHQALSAVEITNEYDPASPDKTLSPRAAFALLLRRQREMAAIITAIQAQLKEKPQA